MDSTHVNSALVGPKPQLGLATERLRDQLAFSTNLVDNRLFWQHKNDGSSTYACIFLPSYAPNMVLSKLKVSDKSLILTTWFNVTKYQIGTTLT